MSATNVAVSMDETLLLRLDELVRTHPFRSRSQVIQEAVAEKINRMDKSGLARESAKLDRKFEQSLADEGLAGERAILKCPAGTACVRINSVREEKQHRRTGQYVFQDANRRHN